MIHALKLAVYMKLRFFDQNFLGLKLVFTPSPVPLSTETPLGKLLGPAVGCFFLYEF